MTEKLIYLESPATFYATLIPKMREAAHRCGYALGLHGSMQRDLDVIAAPWTEEATDALTLVRAITGAVGGFSVTDEGTDSPHVSQKPHGRLAWTIHFGGQPHVDLSVLPRQKDLLSLVEQWRAHAEVHDVPDSPSDDGYRVAYRRCATELERRLA